MVTYFHLRHPDSERLLADGSESAPGVKAQIDIAECPITSKHIDSRRRISPLFLQVKHICNDELMIWSWGLNGNVVHERLLAEFEQQGFTGFQTKPATVRFHDGSLSSAYREFIVTGWAGMAPYESGIRLVESCPACHKKKYSRFTDVDHLIDWSHWTGGDFFVVWPMPRFTLITERVAEWLLSQRVKSFALGSLEDIDPAALRFGFGPGRLSDYLPEDLAIKFGRPLGIE
jgi:hypothetical protein